MSTTQYLVFVAILFGGSLVFYLIKRWLTIHKYKHCPVCGHNMVVLWLDREIDPKEEKVSIGSVRIFSEYAKEHWSILYCSRCKHEIRI